MSNLTGKIVNARKAKSQTGKDNETPASEETQLRFDFEENGLDLSLHLPPTATAHDTQTSRGRKRLVKSSRRNPASSNKLAKEQTREEISKHYSPFDEHPIQFTEDYPSPPISSRSLSLSRPVLQRMAGNPLQGVGESTGARPKTTSPVGGQRTVKQGLLPIGGEAIHEPPHEVVTPVSSQKSGKQHFSNDASVRQDKKQSTPQLQAASKHYLSTSFKMLQDPQNGTVLDYAPDHSKDKEKSNFKKIVSRMSTILRSSNKSRASSRPANAAEGHSVSNPDERTRAEGIEPNRGKSDEPNDSGHVRSRASVNGDDALDQDDQGTPSPSSGSAIREGAQHKPQQFFKVLRSRHEPSQKPREHEQASASCAATSATNLRGGWDHPRRGSRVPLWMRDMEERMQQVPFRHTHRRRLDDGFEEFVHGIDYETRDPSSRTRASGRGVFEEDPRSRNPRRRFSGFGFPRAPFVADDPIPPPPPRVALSTGDDYDAASDDDDPEQARFNERLRFALQVHDREYAAHLIAQHEAALAARDAGGRVNAGGGRRDGGAAEARAPAFPPPAPAAAPQAAGGNEQVSDAALRQRILDLQAQALQRLRAEAQLRNAGDSGGGHDDAPTMHGALAPEDDIASDSENDGNGRGRRGRRGH